MASSDRGVSFPCFKNKVIVITGASSGIGEATAIEFAKDGAKLALTGRNAERLNAVAQKCISQGIPAENVLQMTGDIQDDAFLEMFINNTVSSLGGVDVLVANAGALKLRAPGEFNKKNLDNSLDYFVRSIYTMMRCCLPHLKKSKGNIITISSIYSKVVGLGCAEYCLAKSAMNHMVANLTHEFAEEGIRINSVLPGGTKTPIFIVSTGSDEYADKIWAAFGRKSGFKRTVDPEEVAAAIQFLASSAASGITGAELVVDCGQTKLPLITQEDLL